MSGGLMKGSPGDLSKRPSLDRPGDVRTAGGGRLLEMYFCFGDYDGIVIAEFPSNVDALAESLAASSSGGFAKVKTTALITMDESVKAMEKAGEVSAEFSQPGS